MFFDYVFYKCCQLYEKNGQNGPELFGLNVLSLLQFFNLISIIGFFFQLFNFHPEINRGWYFVPIIGIPILNGRRYNKINYTDLKEKWNNIDKVTKRKKNMYLRLYIFLTIAFFILGAVMRMTS